MAAEIGGHADGEARIEVYGEGFVREKLFMPGKGGGSSQKKEHLLT